MQRNTKLLIAGGAAALVAVAAVAGAAHAKRGGHHQGHGQMHMLESMAERYDANGDGKLSQAEIDENRASWHGKYDADKDGTIGLKEFEALWLEAKRKEMVREFQDFDEDGDAKVTLDEYKKPLARIVARMDRNGDGVLAPDDRRRPRGEVPPPPAPDGQPGNN